MSKKSIDDKVADVLIPVTEDEFLMSIHKSLKIIEKQKDKYIKALNDLQTYKAFNYAINYYYNQTKKTYECEFVKKGKIGFEQSRPYEPGKNIIEGLKGKNGK